MRKSAICLAVLVAATLSTSALAHQKKKEKKRQLSPQWNVVEVGYLKADLDKLDELTSPYKYDLDGFSFRATSLLSKEVFLIGEYSVTSDTIQYVDSPDSIIDVSVDYTRTSAGLGYLYGISKTADIYATVTYEAAEVEAESEALGEAEYLFDESGFGVGIGVRSMVYRDLELGAKIDHIDLDDTKVTSLRGDINYYLTKRFALGVSYKVSDEEELMGVSVRYTF